MQKFLVLTVYLCLSACALVRNARLLAAAELRKWELDSEQAPFDDLRFWKLTADGSMHAFTVPDALFATKRTGRRVEAYEGQQQQQLQTMSTAGTGGESVRRTEVNGSRSRDVLEGQPQAVRRRPDASSSDIGRGLDETRNGGKHRGKRFAACSSMTATAPAQERSDTGRVDPNVPNPSGSDTAFAEEKYDAPEFDRFGRRIKVASNHADRLKLRRLEGPPEGTLITLGWGWGGEFRIGTGRDGFEIWPRHLHPNFKVFPA